MRQSNKLLLVFLFVICRATGIFAQADQAPAELKTQPPVVKADDVNKVENKIDQYWFVILKTGPKQDFDSARKAKLFEGHMANMGRLYNEGILKVAGPFGKNDFKWRGIFIFDCKTKEEAEKIASSDPAIAAGLFAVDIVPWYSEPVGSFVHGKPKTQADVDNK